MLAYYSRHVLYFVLHLNHDWWRTSCLGLREISIHVKKSAVLQAKMLNSDCDRKRAQLQLTLSVVSCLKSHHSFKILQLLQVGSFFFIIPKAILHYYIITGQWKILLTVNWFLMTPIIDKTSKPLWKRERF